MLIIKKAESEILTRSRSNRMIRLPIYNGLILKSLGTISVQLHQRMLLKKEPNDLFPWSL